MSNRNRDTTIFRLLPRCLVVVLPLLSVHHVTAGPSAVLLADTEASDNAHWDSTTGNLYYTELSKTYIRLDPAANQIFGGTMHDHAPVYFIIPIEGPSKLFVASVGGLLNVFAWDGSTNNIANRTVEIPFGLPPNELLTTGKVDCVGRLWVATDSGSIYSVAPGAVVTKVLTDVGKPQAIAFSKFCSTFYFVDSDKSILMGYDFNLHDGTISTPGSVIFDFKANNINTVTNGLTVDGSGHAWIGCHDTKKIVQIDLGNKTISRSVDFLEAKVTSLAFGGPHLDILYATTVQRGTSANSGGLFQVIGLETIGLPGTPYKV